MVKGKSKKNAVIISYITMFVQFGTVFLITPFLLRQLGPEEYGLFQYVSSMIAYLSLLGFGFSASYIRFFSKYKKDNDETGIESLNGMFMFIFIIAAVLCFLIGGIIFFNIENIFGTLENAAYNSTRIMVAVLTVNMALTFPKSLFVCNTTANEEFVFQRAIILFDNILTPTLQVLFVIFIKNAYVLSVVVLIVTSIDLFINIIFNINHLHIRFRFGKYDKDLFKELVAFTFFIFLNQILDILGSTNIDNYIIGRIKGTNDVTVYSMGGKLNSMFNAVSAPVAAVFVPLIYKIVEEDNDKKKLTTIFTRVGKIQFVFLYLIYSGFVFWGNQFIYYWIGAGYEESYYIALVLMGSYIIARSQSIGVEIQRAENMHKARSIVYLIIDIGNVMISIPLVHILGALGAALGTALSMFLGTGIFMNIYYKRKLGLDIMKYWKQVLRIVIFTIPCLVLAVIMKNTMSVNMITMVFQITAYTVLYGAIVFFTVLDRDERNKINIIRKFRRD